jgi:hypothetical protein
MQSIFWVTAFGSLLFFASQVSAAGLMQCVQDVCLRKSSGSVVEVRERLGARGSPVAMTSADRARTYCVGSGKSTSLLFLYQGDGPVKGAELGAIGVTQENVCHRRRGRADEVNRLLEAPPVTLLGMSKSEITKLFGVPAHVVDTVAREKQDRRYANTTTSSRFGAECWIFSSPDPKSLLVNEVCFDQTERVRTVWLSESP